MKKFLLGSCYCLRGRRLAGAAYGRRRIDHPAVDRDRADDHVNTPTGHAAHAQDLGALRSCRRQTVTVPINGTPTTESGPSLASLLTFAGVQYNSACKNDELRYWVQATNAKGAGGRRSPPASSTPASATGRRSSRSTRTATS